MLDVGSGSGWTTALLADIVGKHGKVVGLELIPDLAESGARNLHKYGSSQAEIRATGDVAQPVGECNRILVSAAGDRISEELLTKLAPRGTMVMPFGSTIVRILKREAGKISVVRHEGFAFVPIRF